MEYKHLVNHFPLSLSLASIRREIPRYILFGKDATGVSSIGCIQIVDGACEQASDSYGSHVAPILFNSETKAQDYLKKTRDVFFAPYFLAYRELFLHLILFHGANPQTKYVVTDPLNDSPLQGLKSFYIRQVCCEIDDGKIDEEGVLTDSFFLVTA